MEPSGLNIPLASRIFGLNPLCKLRCSFTHTDTHGQTQCRVVPLRLTLIAAAAAAAAGTRMNPLPTPQVLFTVGREAEKTAGSSTYYYVILFFVSLFLSISNLRTTCEMCVSVLVWVCVVCFFLISVQLPADHFSQFHQRTVCFLPTEGGWG